ncbi:unnamed protein product [Paramecium primaurelia]|uniref:Uncharacterized protein n=1 Tax=Paramecium primaurelia TaxID=5886 RepID=A0A8S1Q4V1_PARPR|nr:unnamed protein product [Paramecium primaurelia]
MQQFLVVLFVNYIFRGQSIIHKGEYSHGNKIGLWEEIRLCCDKRRLKIGEKIYD